MAEERVDRRLAAILVADVVGYSGLIRADEEGTRTAVRQHITVTVEPQVAAHRGRIFKTMGDGLLAEFASVVDAVRCAVEIQNAIKDHIADVAADKRIEFRIGINLGDVIAEGDDLHGDGVNVAARLEGMAEPQGICISGSVFEQVRDKLELGFEDLGDQQVKNIDRPVRAYRVLTDPDAAGKIVTAPKIRATRWKLPAVAAALVVIIAAGGLAWWYPRAPDREAASVDRIQAAAADKPSIAVLPFVNMSDDPQQEYFSEGITEDIITDLSKFEFFFVVSRNSSFAYKGLSVDVKDVARELGVQYVLEGSVRKLGDRLRVTAQLIDAVADKHVWAERYDRPLKDIFQVQDDITQSIVSTVAPKYFSAELRRAKKSDERNLDAWDSYMRAFWHYLRYTRDDNEIAQSLLRRSIDLEPQQASAHGLLAVTHLMDAFYGWSESREVSFREALAHAEQALALDGQNTLALRSVGLVHFFSKNHDLALRYYEKAVKVNPNEAENRALFGAALGVAGEYELALEQFETALRLSPRDSNIATWYHYLSIAAFLEGRDEEAAEWARKTMVANPQLPAGPRTLAASYVKSLMYF